MQPARFDFCQYFGFVFISYCAVPQPPQVKVTHQPLIATTPPPTPTHAFVSAYEWTYVNFTWPSASHYQDAITSGHYIPEHNALVGVKFYKDHMYLALPRLRPGTPVTLATVSTKHIGVDGAPARDLLLTPFPSWSAQAGKSCATLQNVQSMEIDRRGIMWVLDGTRINALTPPCPPKLVLFDLNNHNKVVQTYIFDNDLCKSDGGFLNDIVIDESDGGYAYITDNGAADPGLIVYARKQRRAWKLRDASMFPELDATNFTVDGVRFGALAPIDGIALSPLPPRHDQERIVYYSALSGRQLYALSTRVLRNERFCAGDQWRRYVKRVGRKRATGDGMLIDNRGNLFYGLLEAYGVARWNIYERFETASVMDTNAATLVWPDSFAMDASGYLYVLCNGIHKYFDPSVQLAAIDDTVRFRVMKIYTGNKNYMYTA